MLISELIRSSDNPLSTISYPYKTIAQSSSGHDVIGLDGLCASAKYGDNKIVGPINVVRQPGLGDKCFALAATYKYIQENPDVDVTFSGLDSDNSGWMKECIKFCKIGVNHNCNTIVNLDNTEANPAIKDRCLEMGRILGVEVEDIRFPIKIPKIKKQIDKPYFVFAPFSNRNGPRSLSYSIVEEIMQRSSNTLVLTDGNRYNIPTNKNTYNLSGISMLEVISLIANADGIIGVDSGLIWLAAALDTPALCFFSHVPARDRTMVCQNVTAVEPYVNCARNCGDHVGTHPSCLFKKGQFVCMSGYTTEFILYRIHEWIKSLS